jgi:hypothetical protein
MLPHLLGSAIEVTPREVLAVSDGQSIWRRGVLVEGIQVAKALQYHRQDCKKLYPLTGEFHPCRSPDVATHSCD